MNDLSLLRARFAELQATVDAALQASADADAPLFFTRRQSVECLRGHNSPLAKGRSAAVAQIQGDGQKPHSRRGGAKRPARMTLTLTERIQLLSDRLDEAADMLAQVNPADDEAMTMVEDLTEEIEQQCAQLVREVKLLMYMKPMGNA
jgi:hypothetical protein